jgi:hypothetical protein
VVSLAWACCEGTSVGFPLGRGLYPLPPGTSSILGVEFSGTVEEAGSSDAGSETESGRRQLWSALHGPAARGRAWFHSHRIARPLGRGLYPLPPGTSSILGVEFSGTVEEAGSSDFKYSAYAPPVARPNLGEDSCGQPCMGLLRGDERGFNFFHSRRRVQWNGRGSRLERLQNGRSGVSETTLVVRLARAHSRGDGDVFGICAAGSETESGRRQLWSGGTVEEAGSSDFKTGDPV